MTKCLYIHLFCGLFLQIIFERMENLDNVTDYNNNQI